tara:strand:- start:321 stop:641 length:321 start_codon:yes stop_codon:yes gene_type:complete
MPVFAKNNMHFKNFQSQQAGMASIELSLYIAPENVGEDSPDLVDQSLFFGSGIRYLGQKTLNELKKYGKISEPIAFTKLPPRMLVQEDAADLIQTQVVEPTDEEEN